VNARAIGVDVGTSGVRAAALAADDVVLAQSAVAMATFGDPKAPRTWWRAVSSCLAQLGASCDLSALRGLAVDGTSGTMVAIDGDGAPVGAAIMYDEPCDDETILRAIERHAPVDTAARGRASALARVLVMQKRPGVRRIIHQADWIAGRLMDRFDRSDANNALKTGYDPVAQRWPDWLANAGVDVGKLPGVLEPGEPIGPIGPEGAALGLPATAIVHAGTTDGCASFLATGAVEIGDAVTALGSTLVVKLLCEKPIFAPQYGVYSHRIGAGWLAGGASNTGGAVIERLFGRDRLAGLSAKLKSDLSTGLHYYPLTTPGERFPISDAALAPRLAPRPDDEAVFFQGVLEGVAEIEALGYRRLVELGAPRLRSVRTVGGGAANEGWMAIRRRLLDAPFAPASSNEACVGVARLVLREMRAA
jgi:sugar (pentulose or hexulose) kinase